MTEVDLMWIVVLVAMAVVWQPAQISRTGEILAVPRSRLRC